MCHEALGNCLYTFQIAAILSSRINISWQETMKKAQWAMESKIGTLYLVASEKGLCAVFWEKQDVPMATTLDKSFLEHRVLAQAEWEIAEYLDGKRQNFEVPLDIQGTDFQKKVWLQLLKIPYGQTLSYLELAKQIQNEKSVRAVGTANGRNPLCVVIPCHRVIASNGTLGGYSGGLEIKSKLLALEGNI
jgi:methylated-DNA-[protein]-cysteine S-methyltransferase